MDKQSKSALVSVPLGAFIARELRGQYTWQPLIDDIQFMGSAGQRQRACQPLTVRQLDDQAAARSKRRNFMVPDGNAPAYSGALWGYQVRVIYPLERSIGKDACQAIDRHAGLPIDPVKITDLASKMVRLSGFDPYVTQPNQAKHSLEGDIEIRFTGLRPGEKLYEVLLIGERVRQTAHPRIMSANEVSLSLQETEALMSELVSACKNSDSARLQ